MGFSLVGSFGSHVLVRNSRLGTVKFQSLSGKEMINYNFMVPKFKTSPGRALLCKRELVDFEERTSPNEVNLLISLKFFLLGVSKFQLWELDFCCFSCYAINLIK